jgi:hypothetical protein
MINRKLLLNTYKFADDAELVSALATGFDNLYLDIGSPCIIDKNLFNAVANDDLMPALFPFHHSIGGNPNLITSAIRKNITITSNNCIANNNIRTISVFDFDKLKKLTKCVNDQGSVMFSLFTPCPFSAAKATGKSAVAFINGIHKNILAKYKYHSVSYIAYKKDITPSLGDLRYIIHFISVPNCVPILNYHKVDGIGMVFNIVSLTDTLRKGYIETVFCLSIILSNYMENIFVVDGIDIRGQAVVKSKYLVDAKSIINRSMKQRVKY